MKKNSMNTIDEKSPDVFEVIASTMVQFREEMEASDRTGVRIAEKTSLIIRAVFTVLAICSVYLVIMIFQMSSNMSEMTAHLDDMYNSFGRMSQDVHEMTQSVDSMGVSISGVPAIAESMSRIGADVNAMTGSVYSMNRSMSAMDNDMVRINYDMQEMTGRLYNMRRSVDFMGYNVNQMSRPMNTGPLSGMWPR